MDFALGMMAGIILFWAELILFVYPGWVPEGIRRRRLRKQRRRQQGRKFV